MKIETADFLFAENPNPMWIYDPSDLSIKQVNEAACDLYGYSKEEFLGLTIADLRPKNEISKLNEEVSKQVDRLNNASIWKHRKKNGDLLFVRVLSHPISQEGRQYKLVTAQDVTNKIHYQQELHMLLENSLDGIMLTSPDGRIYKANNAACQILGMSEEQIIKLGREGLVYKDEKFQQALNKREQTGEFSGELTFIHSSGRKIPVEVSTSIYKNPQGQLRTSLIFRDITQQKQYEQQLQESLDRYYYATKATHDAIYEWDIANDELHLGEGFNDIFGYDTAENSISLEEFTRFVHPDDHPEALQSLNKTLKDSSLDHWTQKYRFKKSDGEYAHVVENAYIVRNEEGEATRMIGAIRDVTKQQELEKLLDQAYAMGRIGVWELDLKNDDLYWSTITKELHEVGPDFEPDLETAINFYKEGKSRNIIQEAANKAIEEGIPWDEELQIVTAKGNTRWVRSKGEPEMVEDQCRRLYGIFQDIHDRKEAQTKMLEALRERQRILERITEAFFAVDEDWTVTYWNNRAEEMLGLSRTEVLGNNLWEVFPEAKKQDFFQQYTRALEQQIPVSFEEYYPPISAWLEVQGYPSSDGLSVFFRDITDRKQDQIELEQAYQEKETILESIGDGFFTVNQDWIVTYWNKAAERMLETPRDKILGHNLWEVFSDATDLPSYTNYHRVMNEGISIDFEDYYAPLGRWYDISAYPSGEGISVYFKDITQQKQREAQLQESLNEKETLLSEIHHRVKNNLAVVSGMMQLQMFREKDETLKQKLNESVNRIQTIGSIHELLYQSDSFSRLNIEKNIRKLVGDIARTFQPAIAPEISFDLQTIDLNINQAIPASLIVNEVVTNAFKHAFDKKDQGKLWITMAEANNTVSLQITDNGKGIPADFKLTESMNSLGLQLIDTLTQQLEGDYKYESADGKTHFKLTFKKADIKGSSNMLLDE